MDEAALLAALGNYGADLEPGLSDHELSQAQERFEFAFAPDHRLLLSLALPAGPRWPDWRHLNSEQLRHSVEWPSEGILFDVAENGFWYEGWGEQPPDMPDRLRVARHQLDQAPKLAPVFGHRYLPTIPNEPGNPVLSCWQTDIIYYGADLLDWFECEFGRPRASIPGHVERLLPFWTSLVDTWA
jgi:hypothetical protein